MVQWIEHGPSKPVMEVRLPLRAHGGYGVMAALEFVELSEAVRVRLATPTKNSSLKLFFILLIIDFGNQ